MYEYYEYRRKQQRLYPRSVVLCTCGLKPNVINHKGYYTIECECGLKTTTPEGKYRAYSWWRNLVRVEKLKKS
jgi:hypothetical protein